MQRRRRGTVLPTLGVCLVSLFGFVALAVDLGMLAVARTQCQNAADAAALVGARNLNNLDGSSDTNRVNAIAAARFAARANAHLSSYIQDADIAAITAGQYTYNTVAQSFAVSYPASVAAGDSWSAMRVQIATSPTTYFMRVMGVAAMPTGAIATAVHRPRDIAFALDFTGSMGWSSPLNWPYMNGTTGSLPTEGIMNPDPSYPKFGHYAWFPFYQTASADNSGSGAGSSTIAARPNPLQMKGNATDSQGTYYPANHTMMTSGGPAIIEDFLTAPGDPTTVSSATPMNNAFKMWSPTQTAAAVTSSLTPATYDYSGYNAMTAACPAPDNFDVQSDNPIPYVGDKWPRTDGSRGNQTAAWSTAGSNSFTDSGVYTLKQFLGYAAAAPRDLTQYALPSGASATTLLPRGNTVDGGSTDANYYDALWETYGYDLDVSFLRGQAAFKSKTVKMLSSGTFQGYSMGPGYWGKTFFLWPPDPRFDSTANPASPNPTNPAFDSNGKPICDWRRRFFLRGDGSPFNPQTDNINAVLFQTTPGHTLNPIVTAVSAGFSAGNCPGYYRLNYKAIVAWLKSGPQTLPTNLRSGRILYYSTMPADLTNGSAGDANDITFWREYIHFIFGVGSFDTTSAPLSNTYTPSMYLAGVESRFPYGSLSITQPTAYDPDGSGSLPANPVPYMSYTDNVNRPRMHFWFGPQTMLQFLKCTGEARPWWSGTAHESQCWQLKVAVNSVLDDIRTNHPNDFCGIAGFAVRKPTNPFNAPLAPMGQDWYTLKNVLFFPKATVAAMKANLGPDGSTSSSTAETRPYTAAFANNSDWIPNGKGATDPNTGLAVAFNMLSSSSTLLSTGNYGMGGRRGAAKIVIFETDGQPNNRPNWSIAGSGSDTHYNFSATGIPASWTQDPTLSASAQAAVQVVKNIVAPVAATGQSGFSLPNAPARVYAIAFGDIFNGFGTGSLSAEGASALQFLLRVQQVGNTSPSTDTSLPAAQIITGSYDVRIANLKSALERIAQNGVQVTLIE